ncbi:Type 1 glutamine amidotransferase-like domain-containing protein [Candidatus Nomurabacteria bacterium]|nr:Type 1 glutamine amidotransferase-like domain-containing protein [Candidatus Nomurabacteria bacterium]MCB9827021.1 Type 1 glutamine amidotransferase-like domain-containing protein [Candidatus Nomurabacteria bacterium]MCB9827949.1 Type 1 glutamine amidotransferase-like domain-containing protein [Candidatus Nomurabacteria bacterium]
MKRYVLFSMPMPEVIRKITPLLFPKELARKVFAYMPSDGSDTESNEKYTPFWEILAKDLDAKFNFIDNSSSDDSEKEKLRESNILLITGGNTFTLLNNIRSNELDKEIIKMTNKDDFVIAGFSAGAAILTPTINIVTKEWSYGKDSNNVGLDNLAGLNLVDFEVLPHYTETDEESLEKYSKQSKYDVEPIPDDFYIVIES